MKKHVALGASLVLSALVLQVAPAVSVPATSPSPAPASVAEPPVANGIIVQTQSSDPVIERAAEQALGDAAQVTEVRDAAGSTAVVLVDEVLDGAVAAAVAADLEERSDVTWAVPNYRFRRAVAAPIIPNDPMFGQQYGVWDARSSKVGGYSTKAPYAWRSTRGAGTVVAVVDSGVVASHPDLAGRLVPGYDFIGEDLDDAPSPYYTANDGDGRDADAGDPGDWLPAGDTYCYGESVPQENSSWHGTHVAGIVAATQGNGTGVTGIAPETSVQPVRVLGRCGGYMSDILDGIEWASGGAVPGVPANATRADVINLSLGMDFYGAPSSIVKDVCRAFNGAIDRALSRGSVTVIATGNEYDGTVYSVPARCGSGIAVTATRDDGFLASYANRGSATDIAAPGGDLALDRTGIRSTVDTGSTVPQSASYADYDGTSMAAPAVSAAAALFVSAGMPVKAVPAALRKSVQAFPSSSSKKKVNVAPPGYPAYYRNLNCTTKICGAGILNLAKAPLPVSPPTITGQPGVGRTLTASKGVWSSSVQPSVTYQWRIGGARVPGATKSTYKVPKDYYGQAISVVVRPTTTAFSVHQVSEEITLGTGLAVSAPTSVAYGSTAKITVTAQNGGGLAKGQAVDLLVDGESVDTATTSSKGVATFSLSGTRPLGAVSVAARVVDDTGTWTSSPKTVKVVKATPSVTQSMASSVKAGKPLTITVKVTAKGVVPTGTVTIYAGSTVVATVPLEESDAGVKVVQVTMSKKGTKSMKTVYSGDDLVNGKTSSTKKVKVT